MTLCKATAPWPVSVTGGRVLGPGETGDLDVTDPHNAALILDGQLTPVQAPAEPKPSRAKAVSEEAN